MNFSNESPLGLYRVQQPKYKTTRQGDKSKMYAYAGKILRVNLTTGEIKTEPLSEELAKQYIGGIGLGIKLLMDNSKPGTDAYDPDNPLIYMTGPLSGTMGPTGGNSYAVVSKSPATGCVGNAEAHGFFGPDLKRAGYDAVIITGKALSGPIHGMTETVLLM